MSAVSAAIPFTDAHAERKAQRKREKKRQLPPPTTRIYKNPARWTFNKVVELAESIPLAHVVLLAWVATYFILFQSPIFDPIVHLFGSHQTFKEYWDTLFSRHVPVLSQHNWNTWRHFFRNGGEALLVTLSVLFLTFNPYKYEIKRPVHTAGQVVGRFFFAIACAVPFMILFGWLFHEVQGWFHTGVLAPSVGDHPNLAQKLYSDQWTTKLSVVLAAIVARRPMYPVYAFVQRYFAERRAAKGKRDHWWQPAPFRAMVRELDQDVALDRVKKRSNAVVWLMSGGTLVMLGLAAYGWYILNHFAK